MKRILTILILDLSVSDNTELPALEAAIREGATEGFMGALGEGDPDRIRIVVLDFEEEHAREHPHTRRS